MFIGGGAIVVTLIIVVVILLVRRSCTALELVEALGMRDGHIRCLEPAA